MPDIVVRAMVPTDVAAMEAINAECVPEVGAADAHRLRFIADESMCAVVVDDELGVAAFLLGLAAGTAYDSVNYQWFAGRHAQFGYVDRIAITERARGEGVGVALYRHFELAARSVGATVLCAEVNVEPPNPRSMRFHETFGFATVAETQPKGTPDYRVAMVEKVLR